LKIAIISDIHEDAVSLKKALAIAERERCDHIVCLGDILGYPYKRAAYAHTRNASECILLIKKYCSAVVKGNHDIFHISRFPEHETYFRFPDEWYRLSDTEKLSMSEGRVWHYSDDSPVMLSDNEIAYLESLPESSFYETDGLKMLFSHYLYPNLTGYESSLNGINADASKHFAFMEKHECQISFSGHLHPDGVGLCYQPNRSLASKFLAGFRFYQYGIKKIKERRCTIALPALADNGRENGFAVFDTGQRILTTVSLNLSRRFHL